MDVCITCGQELAIMERNRAECWECRDRANESYSEDGEDDLSGYVFAVTAEVKTTKLPLSEDHSR